MILYPNNTYQDILYLLDRQERANKTQDLMLEGGMATRTNAGMHFFMSKTNELLEINKDLREYPYSWIESIKYIKSLWN